MNRKIGFLMKPSSVIVNREPVPSSPSSKIQRQRAFGADFSDVRVHVGSHVGGLGARAYTQGTAIHFAPGEYAPATAAGRELIAHELAHVVQQRSGQVAAPGGPINADPQLEAEADAAANRVARGGASEIAAAGTGAAAAGPVQRKVVASNPADQDAYTLISTFTSRKPLLAEIEKDKNFSLVLMAGDPAPNHLRDVSGITLAKLFSQKAQIAKISSSNDAMSLGVETLKKVDAMEVEVYGFTTEKHYTDNTVTLMGPVGEDMALIHEVERHAFPFYDLFQQIRMGQFNSSVMDDDGQLNHLAQGLKSGTIGNSIAQHLDPKLGASSARTTLALADQMGEPAATELVFRLYIDTIARGIAFATLRDEYMSSGGKVTTAWTLFAALVARLDGAVLGAEFRGEPAGRRVVVIDGEFRGRDARVAQGAIPKSERREHDDIRVQIENGPLTVLPAHTCYFLK
jgi:hypothetical protein